jgi:magnesium transporter
VTSTINAFPAVGLQVRILALVDGQLLNEAPIEQLADLLAHPTAQVWVDAWGADNPEAQRLAREVFRFHPTALGDCFEVREHPKLEVFDGYLFVITHGITAGSTAVAADTVELDVFLGPRFLFTYHEKPSRSVAGALDLVIRNHGGAMRRGPAGLLTSILDRQVDSMEPLIDDLEERIQGLEDRVLARPSGNDLGELLALKRTTLHLRRWMTKQREVMGRISRSEFALIPQNELVMFRDVYDHLARMTDQLETHREMMSSLHETYLSVSNLRLGEVMKFLALFTAVLMPLTLITGIYGMNFEHMPELRERWAYPLVLGTMAVVALTVLGFFRRRGWMGRPPAVEKRDTSAE